MKKILIVMLCIFSHSVLFAQTNDSRKSAFQFSFFTPLGTNGIYSSEYTNGASVNLLVGISKNEKVFTLGGFSNIILNDAGGLQIAGLSNYVGNEGKGVQIAGLINTNKGSFNGFQIAGAVNTTANMGGAQIGGIVNVADNVQGVQIGGAVNVTGGVSGSQIGGIVNINSGCFNGFQLAGAVNTTANMTGFQLAGLINAAKDVKGTQIAGLINSAGDMNGFQLAGLVNVAKKVKGVQLAGLINIAEDSDCPIGLINIIKNGEMGIAFTYDGTGNAIASFRSGGKYTYGIFGVGYNHNTIGNKLVVEGGLGAHIPVVSWFRINNEIKFTTIGNGELNPAFIGGYSLLPAFKVWKHLELFGGVSINYMQSMNTSDTKIFPKQSLWEKNSPTELQSLYIGYQCGIHFIF